MEFPVWLLGVFGMFWLALAIRPRDRIVWLTENALTVAAVLVLAATHASWPLSDLSYSLIAVFLVLHTIGSHFTYARVPYDSVFRSLFGMDLGKRFGWSRNHYDRLVHFAYGLLIAYPAYELLERYAQPVGAWSYVLSPALIMATSMAFEVTEWWAARVLGGTASLDYLGAQGDIWDAQKDVVLATLGGWLAMAVTTVLV